MTRRGERKPWKVHFKWDTGLSGTRSFSDQWLAQHKATEISQHAETQGRTVTVRVEYASS